MHILTKHTGWYVVLLLLCCNCSAQTAASRKPADAKATAETVNLYNNLLKLADTGFMFGHQDDLAYGVGWRYEEGRSDIKDVTGDYPAVYGWELGGLERDNSTENIDKVPFKKMKQFIRDGYERGGVITISWHADSPLGNNKNAWDTTHGTVRSIVPGGANHELYKSWLDKMAVFLGSLKGSKGEAIPVLFRPFHEHTGHWFWWCKNASTAFDYKTLWRFTYHYLTNEKKLHNLLWVYNTSGNFNSREEFLERYPGDDVVDVLSFDTYQYNDPQKDRSFELSTNKGLALIGDLAKEKEKLFALAETGYEAVPYAEWWTKTLLKAIGDNKISYVMVWRNHGLASWNNKMHFYGPHKGQVSAEDFIRFYNLEHTFFERDIAGKKLYQ